MTQTTYKLTEHERRHLAEITGKMQDFDTENLRLEGSIRRNEHELNMMRRHLALFLGTLAAAHDLPMGARLSPDGTTLIAPADPEGVRNGLAS